MPLLMSSAVVKRDLKKMYDFEILMNEMKIKIRMQSRSIINTVEIHMSLKSTVLSLFKVICIGQSSKNFGQTVCEWYAEL